MGKRALVPLVVLVPLLGACATVLRVDKADGNADDPRGVPFHTKVPEYVQRTTRQESWFDVTITLLAPTISKTTAAINPDPKAKEPPAPVTETSTKEVTLRDVSVSQDGLKAIQSARNEFLRSSAATALDDFLNKVDAAVLAHPAPDVDSELKARKTIVTANTLTTEWVADQTTYYLNGHLPWFGSSSVSTELASDGTLTKVEGQSESKAGDVIASVLPLHEYFSKILGLDTKTQAAMKPLGPAAPFSQTVKIAVQERGYVYAIASRSRTKPTEVPDPLPLDGKHEFTRTSLSAASAPQSDTADRPKSEDKDSKEK